MLVYLCEGLPLYLLFFNFILTFLIFFLVFKVTTEISLDQDIRDQGVLKLELRPCKTNNSMQVGRLNV